MKSRETSFSINYFLIDIFMQIGSLCCFGEINDKGNHKIRMAINNDD